MREKHSLPVPAPAKKYTPGHKMKLALLEVIERKGLQYNVNYKAVAHRYDVSDASLRNVYYRYTRGEVDLGPAMSENERTLNDRMEHERQLDLAKRLRAHVLDGFHGCFVRTTDECSKGNNALAYQATGIISVVKDLRMLNIFINELEKGYSGILEEEQARREALAKQVGKPGQKPIDVEMQVRVANATDEQRALMALDGKLSGEEEPEGE